MDNRNIAEEPTLFDPNEDPGFGLNPERLTPYAPLGKLEDLEEWRIQDAKHASSMPSWLPPRGPPQHFDDWLHEKGDSEDWLGEALAFDFRQLGETFQPATEALPTISNTFSPQDFDPHDISVKGSKIAPHPATKYEQTDERPSGLPQENVACKTGITRLQPPKHLAHSSVLFDTHVRPITPPLASPIGTPTIKNSSTRDWLTLGNSHGHTSYINGYDTSYSTPMDPAEATPRPVFPPPSGMVIWPGYVCDFPNCPAPPFQTQYLLSSHKNIHTNLRHHYCPVKDCPRGEGGKGFKRKNEMIRHGLVHNSPGYVCPFCPGRELKHQRPDSLQRHVRVHHPDKSHDDQELRAVLAQRLQGTKRPRRRYEYTGHTATSPALNTSSSGQRTNSAKSTTLSAFEDSYGPSTEYSVLAGLPSQKSRLFDLEGDPESGLYTESSALVDWSRKAPNDTSDTSYTKQDPGGDVLVENLAPQNTEKQAATSKAPCDAVDIADIVHSGASSAAPSKQSKFETSDRDLQRELIPNETNRSDFLNGWRTENNNTTEELHAHQFDPPLKFHGSEPRNTTSYPEFRGQDKLEELLSGRDDRNASPKPEVRTENESDESMYEEDDLTELPIAPTVAVTTTDEGYQSMDKQDKPSIDDLDDVSEADSVRTDNRDSGLPRNVKEQLSTYFAQEILDNVRLTGDEIAGAIDDICGALPDLLRNFSTLAARQARPGIEERACIFVRHQRNQIARNLRTILSTRPDKSDTPGASDRIHLLWGENRTIDDCPDDRMAADMLLEIKDPTDDLFNLPEIPEARAYLVESVEYKWLLFRILATARTMPTLSTDSNIRLDLFEAVNCENTGRVESDHTMTIRFEIDWHFASFAEEQYKGPEAVELQHVLCCSGLVDKAFVAPCIEYAELLWPRIGRETVLCISNGLRKGSKNMAGHLLDGTTIAVESGSQTTTIIATGHTASLVEVGEILAWLGAACRAAPSPSQISYCRPIVTPGADTDTFCVRISYDFSEIDTTDIHQSTNARCWLQMFRNPTIVHGYPIPIRHQREEGLEVSLSIMACLGATPWAVDFNQTIFLKGFCSLFVAMIQIGQSIIWHFLLQEDGTRVSYNQGLAFKPGTTEISWSSLERCRHFVGWTPTANILAGTKHANYNIQRSASELSKPGIGALSNISISGGKVIQFGASFVRGNKDTPLPIANCKPYEMQIMAASEMNVVFYDTDSQKGWLIDAATALLHISRAWLSSSSARFIPNDTIDQFVYSSACDGRHSALNALVSERNRRLKLFSAKTWITETVQNSTTNSPSKVDRCKETWWCWEDLVQLKWNVLEQIHDHVVTLKTSPDTQLHVPFISKVLEGFDLIDILSDNSQIRPRTIDLQTSSGGWLDIATQNETINIFGSGFGDLIAPTASAKTQPHSNCSQNLPVPEGLDYLAAPLYVLNDIAVKYRTRKDASISLGHSTFWIDPEKCLIGCPCRSNKGRKCMVSLSQLQSLPVSFCKKSQRANSDIFTAHPMGAVIFGNKPNWVTKKRLGKRKQQTNDEADRNTRPRGSDSGIDLGTSSNSGASSSPTHSQASIGDSGIPEDRSI